MDEATIGRLAALHEDGEAIMFDFDRKLKQAALMLSQMDAERAATQATLDRFILAKGTKDDLAGRINAVLKSQGEDPELYADESDSKDSLKARFRSVVLGEDDDEEG
jgi:hypothetical protein